MDPEECADRKCKFMRSMSFQPGISHDRSEHAPHCLYVDPSLTATDMYESYKKACEKRGVKEKSASTGIMEFLGITVIS